MAVASPFPANHGTPGSIREMAEAIAAQGHTVHVVAYHFGDGTPPQGVTIHRTPDVGLRRNVVVGPTWAKPFQDLQMVFVLCRVVRQERIDLIHAHNYEGALVGYLASVATGRPLLYNACNTMTDELASYDFFRPKRLAVWLARVLDYWVPRLPDMTIALSDELGQFLRARGVPPERLHVVPLGVHPEIFAGVDRRAARQRLHPDPGPLVIYTGCLDALQRIDYLMQAMTVVVGGAPDAKLIVLANAVKDRDLQRCHRLVEGLGLDRHVEIVPSHSFEDVPPYLAIADVAVVPRPTCPGFPVKLLNYLAAGKPVVVFEGSAKGLHHGETAILALDHDWRALGHGILDLVSDPALAQRLGANGQRWVMEQYSWPSVTERIIKVYEQLLPQHASAVRAGSHGRGPSGSAEPNTSPHSQTRTSRAPEQTS
jgi:glycosyltransferase involved in cell wall biosynthesis